jgi:hypothetical protein
MRFYTLASVAAVAAFMTFAPAAASAAPQDFVLDNDTGYDLKNLYISPTTTNDWQEDVLGEDVLQNGQSVKIHFPGGRAETCEWDLKVTYQDDTSHEWRDVNLCSVATITIHYNVGSDETSATSTPAE